MRKLDFGILICATLGWVSVHQSPYSRLTLTFREFSGSSVSGGQDDGWLEIRLMLPGIVDIDQSNLTNAYVSGMKEDLNIEGNEYTYMQSKSYYDALLSVD